MTPSIGFSYNSQNSSTTGNGIAGVGWSLDGLPSIARCGRTFAQDNVYGGINYDANDRFCMDGQRLVVISGTYGADGSEYRTEIETFSKIIAHGTAGVGPAWFEVHTKSGQVMEFGNTTDSRILAQGRALARTWGLNKVRDSISNYFTVTYFNDNATGQAYPTRIDYTGNSAGSVAPYNSVQFTYNTSRPDVVTTYHLGSQIQTRVLLTDVKTYQGSTLVADYRLAYQQGSATGRSRLTSIVLCDGSGNTCLPATTFAWRDGATATTAVIANAAGMNNQYSGYVPYLGDFNGDGMTDVLWDGGSPRILWTATGAGNFQVAGNFAGQDGTLVGYKPLVMDINNDGRADVWWYNPTTYATTQWVTTGVGIYAVRAGPSLPTPVSNPTSITLQFVGDLNGDGRLDTVWVANWNANFVNNWALMDWFMGPGGALANQMQSNMAGTGIFSTPIFSQVPSQDTPSIPNMMSVDINGDGLLDLVLSSGRIEMGLGDGTFAEVHAADDVYSQYKAVPCDLNGDGKTDIFWDRIDSYGRSLGARIVWISKGDGTFNVMGNVNGADTTLLAYTSYAADFNGDGRTDILWVSSDTNGLATGARVAWISKGDGTFTVIGNFAGQDSTLAYSSGSPSYGYIPLISDFNGDGKSDVLWMKLNSGDNTNKGSQILWLSDGITPDVMTSVTNGLGVVTTFTYKYGTDSGVYTKDNTAADPVVDVQGAMLLVSRLDTSDGLGGTRSATYKYAGAKMDITGRGFLGFRQMVTTDLQTNIVQTTNQRQDYPYIGLTSSETRALGSTTLGTTTNVHWSNALGGTRYQVFLNQSQTTGIDLDGTALPSSTSTYQYDAYGNATQVVVFQSDGFSKTTTNTYTNDAANWYLGRLTRATVNSGAP